MIKTVLFFLLGTLSIVSQSYPPAADQTGSTAIPAASELFIAWATGIKVTRGLIDITDPTVENNGNTTASFGDPKAALGPASNSPVSLGDGGQAILTFQKPFGNDPGFDFAVFENSFSDTFLELAFVEVSSDGINYFRFPAHSETQTQQQINGFGNLDPTYLNNLAGKYRAMFGTPFDISDLEENPLLDKNSITHIKIIDVVGSIDPDYARLDSYGNAINDPFKTPFSSGGFDLDAIGIMSQQTLGVADMQKNAVRIYPNPATSTLFIKSEKLVEVRIFDMFGSVIYKGLKNGQDAIDISSFQNGLYIVSVVSEGKTNRYRFIKK